MKENMTKIFNFGKIDYYGKGRKINAVTVTVSLAHCGGDTTYDKDGKITGKTPEYEEFTASGDIYNAFGTDVVCAGQCLETIAEYIDDPVFMQILNLWRKYHLNGMHAGTPEQEAFVERYLADMKATDPNHRYDYTEAKEALKAAGLLTVEYTGKTTGRMYDHEPYTYGHGWVVNDLPESVLEEIKSLLQ